MSETSMGGAGHGILSAGVVITISLLYVALLFTLAFLSDRRARSGSPGLLASPIIYTLSIAVYCTSWTFYGAVGSASRSGLEFLPIYLGPTVVFIGWWTVLRKLVRISKTHRITSIADFISSRYGKSGRLAVVVTLFAVVGTTPYIALQLKAVDATFIAVSQVNPVEGAAVSLFADTAFWVAACMAAFAIVFGTRNVGADEHHPGIVAAIAFESLVKLIALISVGLLVVLVLGPGETGVFARSQARSTEFAYLWTFDADIGPRWLAVFFLAGAAIICLPRQFQVAVVEIENERHLATAAWLFPLYLFLISLFVIPIALAGLTLLPTGSNPDLFVLTVPIETGHDWLALFAFIGGFSSATSMVIVAGIALSIMLSNHVIMPVIFALLPTRNRAGVDLSGQILWVRRASIVAIFSLALVYYRVSAPDALASIGLISFTGVAQFLPALIGGLYWRGATERGALTGLLAGFGVWIYTSLLPPLLSAGTGAVALLDQGPWGIGFLRPQALFGADGWDPLVHALFWSYVANIGSYVAVSLLTRPGPLERLQNALFIDAFRQLPGDDARAWQRSATAEDLYALTERILGRERAYRVFSDYANSRDSGHHGLHVDAALIAHVERVLAGSVGAASARVLISGVTKGETISLDEVIGILDETQQVIEYSHRLEAQSKELEHTASQLRQANEQLQRLDKLKDDFVSRVSHELRTPMTSIRAISELLLEYDDIPEDRKSRSIETIAKESQRLSHLLDEILDLASMAEGEVSFEIAEVDVAEVLRDALAAVQAYAAQHGVRIEQHLPDTAVIARVDRGRLTQVFINLLSNAIKFNDNGDAFVRVTLRRRTREIYCSFADNGPGVPAADQALIFSKFTRSSSVSTAPAEGSGLGLAISQEIIHRFGGRITLVSSEGRGATFTVNLPTPSSSG